MLIRLSTAVALCLTFLTFTLASSNVTQVELSCSPFGRCEPCPEDALQEPFCRPFGNRRLVHCVNDSGDGQRHSPPESLNHQDSGHPEGETIAWESCGRIPHQERADFYEFVACNILFAVIALVVLFARSKRLQAIQARQLAARIGLGGR
ncbi:hypothetical protein JOM56_012162 [Amanita muscaria]